jgi:signal peptidase I
VTISKGILRDLVEVVVLALGLYLIATTTIQTVHVVGVSMTPTLQNNDLLIASRIDYRLHSPERGDIVILKSPLDPSHDYVKRVIGLPHDRILIRDHRVLVNGIVLDEPYVSGPTDWTTAQDQTDGALVPDGMYFVMGDNRDHSSDSRVFGWISRDQIDGKVLVRFWPLAHAAVLNLRPSFAKH